MTTTELIEMLKKYERGASGRSREISFVIIKDGEGEFIFEPKISFYSSGDGVAGSELTLLLQKTD